MAPRIPSVPPGCRLCSPTGVSRAFFAFYSCLALLLAGDSVGNNEVGEHETQSKCTSCNESARRFLCVRVHRVLSCTGTTAAVPSSSRGCRLWGQQQQQRQCLKVHVRDPQLKPGTIPPPHSHLSGEELPAAQCITPEEQSGSTFKAKISILKDAIKQSQGRVYREAIAVPGEKWSPEANPPGFIACYR